VNDFRIRGVFLQAFIVAMGIVFAVRLLYLQVMSDDYALKSDEKDMKEVILRPSRGIVFDRNQEIIVRNTPVFDLMIIPNELYIPDTSIIEQYLDMSRSEIREKVRQFRGLEMYQPKTLKKHMDSETATRLSEHLWGFKGIYLEAKNTREYLHPFGANFLGYINQVGPEVLDADTTRYYQPRDLIGISGIENYYETLLRGNKGKKYILVDAYTREVGRYAGGKLDESPVEGSDIQLGLDIFLQQFGEEMMRGKKGSIVAIEPSTGEILAFVSSPSYDPNLFTGGDIGHNYDMLEGDTALVPLFNRALMAQYPPGSIFKLLQTLAAMSEGIIGENTYFSCGGAWFRNGGKPSCHGAHGSIPLIPGIKHSCNAYYAETYYSFLNHSKFGNVKKAYNRWHEVMTTYGIGRRLGIDIPNEQPGNLPTSGYFDDRYRGSWGALTVYSMSIGQGEVQMTPLQMANMVALIANRGWYIQPHFLRSSQDELGNWVPQRFDTVFAPNHPTDFDIVTEAMQQVVDAGTGIMARIDSIPVCGKTGTVENPPMPDHSVFVGFAPRDKPQIAVAVIVENAGWGGNWAGPIASLMMEMRLRGKIKDDWRLQRILDADFIKNPLPNPVKK